MRGVTNANVQEAIVARLSGLLPGAAGRAPTVGSLRANYYSFTFSVDFGPGAQVPSVFVKIPKVDLRLDGPAILPISPEDRRMAQEEARSLAHLERAWHGDDLGVRWVRLLGEEPEFNALISARIRAPEALDLMRSADRRRWAGLNGGAVRMRGMLHRFGAALSRFHNGEAKPEIFTPRTWGPKLMRYAADIDANGNGGLADRVGVWVKTLPDATPAAVTTTLKGIDVRNMLWDGGHDLTLLDPGPMKRTFCEADLARFILTFRILHWGEPWFPLLPLPDPQSEQAFLAGYGGAARQPSPLVLQVFMVKEILKHWHTARMSLALKKWRAPLQRLVRSTYIDPFYSRQIARELREPV